MQKRKKSNRKVRTSSLSQRNTLRKVQSLNFCKVSIQIQLEALSELSEQTLTKHLKSRSQFVDKFDTLKNSKLSKISNLKVFKNPYLPQCLMDSNK